MSTITALPPSTMHSATKPLDPKDDRRSSSLSDLVESAGRDGLETADPAEEDRDGNDTEAETERLEDSPFKRPKQQNVVLASGNANDIFTRGVFIDNTYDDRSRSLSEASLTSGSNEERMRPVSATSSPRKRKRFSVHQASEHEAGLAGSPRTADSPSSGSVSPGPLHSVRLRSEGIPLPTLDPSESDSADVADNPMERFRPRPGKRKGRRSPEEQDLTHRDITDKQDINGDLERNREAADSNGDDIGGDDAGEADLENATKSQEELVKKRSALDSLSGLEKCFATLRDRLFDERLAAANEELTLLQKPDFVHQELQAMKEAIDRHRQQKVEYQQTFLKYKLETLQRESVATKHQIQSQYMQTVRGIRDDALDQLNKEFCQVQRERRSRDGEVPDSMFLFNNNRLQQIRQQTAYNSEVSVLSGVAKYVGFPAAPPVKQARPNELDEDMRSMGIAAQPPRVLQNNFSSFRANLSATGALNRQTPTAEESFLERNAWANPQHPAHQQRLQLHRQVSNLAQPTDPIAAPVARKGADTSGTGITVFAQTLAASSSRGPTPASIEQMGLGRASPHNTISGRGVGRNTPSRTPALPQIETSKADSLEVQPPSLKAATAVPGPSSRLKTPSMARNPPVRDGHTPNTLPRPLPLTQTAASRAQASTRLPVKAEDSQSTRRSPGPRQFTSPAPAILAGIGQSR